MNPLRSVGARLSLALLVVLLGALAIVYVAVVPSLERRLVDAKLSQLTTSAESLGRRVPADPFEWQPFVDEVAPSTNARVVVFAVERFFAIEPLLSPFADSQQGVVSAAAAFSPIAARAAQSGETQRGTVERRDTRFAEVAVPLGPRAVLLLSAPLTDTLATVDLVERRLVVAGLLALVAAVAIGYGAASAFARRIRRLERAAERIAGGRFDEPVVDSGRDELGELAAAFERMRGQLAHLDHARREFIANASHELRTPIFSLSGFLELLADEDLDDETRRDFLVTMGGQVERLTKLATDLLDLSRLDAGRLRVERAPVDLSALARVLAAEFRPLAQARGHELELAVDGEATALGDEQRVLRIGRALVENAIVHTPAGTTVRIKTDATDGVAGLSVEDDGPGIPEEQRSHVFERFYRVDGGTASGSGLGLAIARELAQAMGGNVELEPRSPGAAVTLRLPRAVDEAFSRENGSPAPVATVDR